MNRPEPDPELLEFVKALARADVARDIASARRRDIKGSSLADRHLRPVLEHAAK
jgi:hypothetical protein